MKNHSRKTGKNDDICTSMAEWININHIVTGFLIGIMTSIPVGPIALLCLQRSLQKGHWYGFASGLGAAFSDGIYACIALFGLSFVIDFVNKHTLWIQLVGAVVIMGFGIYTFFKNPTANLHKAGEGASSYWQDFLSAFVLCFSNPMMIFLFLGLFGSFDFLSADASWFQIVVGMGSVFVGAATWWFLITLGASVFRDKVNMRGLWIINKVTGSAIIIIAVAGLVMSLMGKSIL